MTHPGDPIDPASHAALLAQPDHAGHPVISGQDATELAHLPFERLHRHHRRGLHDGGLQILQFGSGGVIQLASQAGHGVDMPG